ncbi:MAG: VWA domain-containing protein [Chloroflexota bacterium]|nr:VWA domain-containing protein [Chloroflexota bacterium]
MVGDFGLSFSRPLALLLLLLLVPLTVYLSRTSLAFLRRGARRWSLGLRLAIVVLLVLSLAGVGITRADQRLSVVYLLDRSDSVSAEAQAQQAAYVSQAISELREGDAAGVVVFGSEALVDRPVVPDKTIPDLASAPSTTYSNLAEALRLGLAVAPGDTARRMVLLSDGRENLGSAEWSARLAGANGVAIDVVPLPSASGPEVWVESLRAPSPVRENERVALQLGISSSVDTTATLLISVDGTPLSTQEIRLVRGTNSYVQNLPPAVRGFHTYSAQVVAPTGTDTRSENNRYSAFSLVLGKPRVLIVEGKEGEAEALRLAIAPSVDSDVMPPSSMPTDIAGLAGYDGIVLVNVPASSLTKTGLESLQVVVRDLGKGLVVVGGDESYAAGGYWRTPLEEMLPVDLNLPSKLDIPSVGMVLVIDRSGSMGVGHVLNGAGVTKLSLAKEAAYQAVAQLSGKDYVGVIAFDSAATWAVELQPLGDPTQFHDRIQGISLGGGTNIYSGLHPAVQSLIASKARSKHIVVLTDGVSEGGDYEGLVEQMAANDITLSSVAVGSDADEAFLKNLATVGKGRFYSTEDGNALPQIFAHESHIAARSYLIEHPFAPARTSPSAILDGLGGLPTLQGYVGTSPKPTGQVALVSDAGDPVLAQWQYGLGRVVAWTSDAKGQWATDWVAWPDFPRFWTQALRWSTGAEAGNMLQPRVEWEGGTARVSVDAAQPDGSLISDVTVGAQVVGPDLVTATVSLKQTAAGRYEGTFSATEEGAYLLQIRGASEQIGSVGQTLGMVVPYSPEYRGAPTDSGLLARLAALTGGRVLSLDNPAASLEHNLPPARSTNDLWPLLLFLAILLLPFDVGVRRLAITRADVDRAWAELRRRLGWTGRAVPATAPQASTPQVAALFGAKERSRERLDAGPANPSPTPDSPAKGLPAAAPARDLQLEGRTGRSTSAAQSRTPSHAAPESPPQGTAPETPHEDMAARLRRAREQRH